MGVKQRKQRRWLTRAGTAMFAVLLVVLVIPLAVRAVPSGKEYVAEKLVDYLAGHPNDKVAELLGTYLVGEDATFGATQTNSNTESSNFAQIGFVDPDSPPTGIVREGWIIDNIGTASSTFLSIRNRYKQPIYYDRIVVSTGGTAASTTVRLTAGTSTVSGLPYNATPTIGESSMLYALITTSSISRIDSAYGLYQPNGTATGTSKLVEVKEGEYLIGLLKAEDPKWAVTTTANRGFSTDAYYAVHYYLFSTSTPL